MSGEDNDTIRNPTEDTNKDKKEEEELEGEELDLEEEEPIHSDLAHSQQLGK